MTTASAQAVAAVRRRILLILPTFFPDSYGGAERQAQILAEALSKLGVEVRIVTPTLRDDLPASEPTAFGSVERVRVRAFPNYGGRRLGSTLAWTRQVLRRFGRPGEADAAYVFHARLHVLPALGLSRRGVPLLVKLGGGGAASDFEALRAKRFFYGGWVLRQVLRRTDGFVANSAQIVDDLHRCGVPDSRIFAFPNGVRIPPEPLFEAGERRRTGARFVFTGRMITDKSVAVLFEAACRLLVAGRELELTFLGDGPEQDRLEALARERGVADRIRFPGACEDVYPALFESDFFVSASEREGQSNSLLEAMSAGCIPLVFGASGAGDLIEDGVNGVLVPRSEPDAFAQAMARALDMPAEARRAMGRAVRDRTARTIGVDAVAARTLEALDTVIARRAGAAAR